MNLTEALRKGLADGWLGYSLDLPPNRSVSLPIEHLWTLKRGGIAFVLTGARSSPACEAHLMEGRVIGEGPWQILDAKGRRSGWSGPTSGTFRTRCPGPPPWSTCWAGTSGCARATCSPSNHG